MRPHPNYFLDNWIFDEDLRRPVPKDLPSGRARPGRQTKGFMHRGHLSIRTGSVTLRLADIAWAIWTEKWPANAPAYRDGDPTNLTEQNLDWDAYAKGGANDEFAADAPTYKGVLRTGPYSFRAQARIKVDGKSTVKYLGTFPTAEAARDAVVELLKSSPETKRRNRAVPAPTSAVAAP